MTEQPSSNPSNGGDRCVVIAWLRNTFPPDSARRRMAEKAAAHLEGQQAEIERLRAALKKAKPIVGSACAAAGATNANDTRRLREKVYAEICAALEAVRAADE